jgi:hypothetical protein
VIKTQRAVKQGSDEAPPVEWLAERVTKRVLEVEHPEIAADQQAMLKRMTSDPRMKGIWSEFLRHKKGSAEYLYPAKSLLKAYPDSKKEAQFAALREIFESVFSYARDKQAVSKPSEIRESKEISKRYAGYLETVATDLESACMTGQLGISDPLSKQCAAADAATLRRVAKWLKKID